MTSQRRESGEAANEFARDFDAALADYEAAKGAPVHGRPERVACDECSLWVAVWHTVIARGQVLKLCPECALEPGS